MNKQSSTLAIALQVETVPLAEITGRVPDAVKDSGRVRIGAGLLRFTDGRTSDVIKDTGRVRIGAGLLRF